jgi:hypothetical protein
MKNLLKYFLLAIMLMALQLSACKSQKNATKIARINPAALYDEGVVINGVKWATRNVGDYQQFAPLPTSTGWYYWFNRPIGVDMQSKNNRSSFSNYDISASSTDLMWDKDPCPIGWRIPTTQEFSSLIESGSVAITAGGINGRLFGEAPNQIFLPAAGRLGQRYTSEIMLSTGEYGGHVRQFSSDGRETYNDIVQPVNAGVRERFLWDKDIVGAYWGNPLKNSIESTDIDVGISFLVDSDEVNFFSFFSQLNPRGISIRCVAE